MIHETAEIRLWGNHIATVAWDEARALAGVSYDRQFLEMGIEVAPFKMPLGSRPFVFADLDRQTFKGLPGLLVDSLPDKFGNTLLDQWIVRQGGRIADYSPVDRLCYVGTRGMGALEFVPALSQSPIKAEVIAVDTLVRLANMALSERGLLQTSLDDEAAVEQIIRVGTSAGGARAKALVLWNPETNEVYSGQLLPKDGFEYWLMKFDGVDRSGDKEGSDPAGYGQIEYAYYLAALDAGITMNKSVLFEEQGRHHFMTKRFDRLATGEKLHMQSLCALCHYDFNIAGGYSYEQAIQCCQDLHLGKAVMREMFRRMCFNVIMRNQDDHTKNIAFLMDKQGQWALSPAFDVTYSYNPNGAWTSQHQMTINGKRDHFTREDLLAVARLFRIGKPNEVIDKILSTAKRWPTFALQAKIDEQRASKIGKTHRVIT